MIRRQLLLKNVILGYFKKNKLCIAQRILGLFVFRLGKKLIEQLAWALAEEIEKECMDG